jgi:DNA replication protein DnaC
MRSRKKNPDSDLISQLRFLGLDSTAAQLDDLLSRAIKNRWPPRSLLEELARTEVAALTQRSLDRRLRQAQLGRFKPMADFDWNWPKKIDRDLVERALTLDFIPEARNFILIGNNGLGKTMITKNIAYAAVQAGYSVLMRTASDLLADLAGDSPLHRRRKFNFYARPDLLCIDEVGYLNYDAHAADLLYEVINRRYERRSLLITTNRVFKEWNQVFPNSSSITTLLDRLTHHADVTVLEGSSYRLRESELESAARRTAKARR